MIKEDNQDLFLRSLDSSLHESEKAILQNAYTTDTHLIKHSKEFILVRELLAQQKGKSFGPFFAERVINHIRAFQQEIEYQVFSFFKKYQLVAVGLIVALFISNMMLADSFTIKSIIGLEENAIIDTTTDIFEIDIYQNLTK
jgi:hypothetical protein